MARRVFCLYSLFLLICLAFAHNYDPSSSLSSTEEQNDHISPETAYEYARHTLERQGAKHRSGGSGISGYLFDLMKSFFTYSSPVAKHQPAVGHINGVKYHNSEMYSAMEMLYKAANGGNSDAIYTLADMNFFGNYSHPRNVSEAFKWYNLLADTTGNGSAQHMVGFIHATGFGDVVKQDQSNALLYFTFAAEQGNERSQMVLGYRHALGIGAPKNCEVAVRNYRKVAKRAINHLRSGPPGGTALHKVSHRVSDDDGGIYGEGASVSSSGHNARHGGSSSDSTASFDDIIEWLHVESKKGNKKALLNLGTIHYEGVKGRAPDYPKAKKYFLEVARLLWSSSGKVKNDVSANEERLAARAAGYLGRMYLRGEGGKQDFQLARLWLKRGVDRADALSQHHLALIHLDGLGNVEPAQKYAADLFSAAADQDYAPSLVRMAVLFLDSGDSATALEYLHLAIRHGNAEALYYLAELTLAGITSIEHGGQAAEKTCDRAVQLFKSVSEKAESVVSSLKEADDSYKHGDFELALIDNMLAAEQGFEVAQTNTAYLMDKLRRREAIESDVMKNILATLSKWVPRSFSLPLSPSLALVYWTRAARQMNIDALVKMGDHYLAGYSGISSSTIMPDAEKAAACYQAAADTHQSGQALWNLGWMHENGVGPMEQDFHLAKRFYDLALEMTSEAYLPVKLALLKLRMRSWWNEWTRGGIKSIEDERSSLLKAFSFREWWAAFLEDAMMNNQHEDGTIYDPLDPLDPDVDPTDPILDGGDWEDTRTIDDMTDEELWDEAVGGLLESVMIIGLTLLLGILLIWRRAREENAERQRQRERDARLAEDRRNDQGGLAGQENPRGMFPERNDPDFMNWEVGGVGH